VVYLDFYVRCERERERERERSVTVQMTIAKLACCLGVSINDNPTTEKQSFERIIMRAA
jgi:hypothetical protein